MEFNMKFLSKKEGVQAMCAADAQNMAYYDVPNLLYARVDGPGLCR